MSPSPRLCLGPPFVSWCPADDGRDHAIRWSEVVEDRAGRVRLEFGCGIPARRDSNGARTDATTTRDVGRCVTDHDHRRARNVEPQRIAGPALCDGR